MEETPFVEDDEEVQEICDLSRGYMAQGDHINALEVIESWITAHQKKKVSPWLRFQEGEILVDLANRRDNKDVKIAFLLGSVECFSGDDGLSSFCGVSLYGLGAFLGSSLYYKKSVGKAKEYLTFLASFDALDPEAEESRREVENMLKTAESRIASGSPMAICEPEVREPKKNPDPREKEAKELISFWSCLNVEVKRKLMEVSIAEFTSYVQRLYGTEGRDALEKVLGSVMNNKKWRVLMCRSCSKEFLYHKKFRNHIEQEHVAKFKPSTTKHMGQMVDEVWAGMITVAGWEPVDTVAAVEMIKTRLKFLEAFVYENGWSRDWPLVADEERSKLLNDIRLLLLLLWERKILSRGLRDWMIHFLIKHLAQFEVSEHTLTECRLLETPQSICFLEGPELGQILGLLKLIKCERNDGTELICRAVDSFYNDTRVKEKIDFDKQVSSLLLDKRLLRCEIAQFDDEGAVSFVNPNDHYAKAHACGDDIISWLADHSSGDERFRFPSPVRAHNLDIWVAVLRAVQFTCRTLGTKYAKKLQMLGYDAALQDAKNLCIHEDERRRNAPKALWNKYASLLREEFEKKYLRTEARDSLNTRIFLCSVRDVLEEASQPTFHFPDLEVCLNLIHGRKNLSDDIVLKSIDRLRSVVANKVPLVDSKMLLIENSRINLLNALIRLSVFDYRSYILGPLKEFLLEVMNAAVAEADLLLKEEKKPQSKTKKHKSKKEVINAAVAEADLLLNEEKKPQSKKKKHKSKKKTSTSMSSPLDKTVEHEHSVNLELQGTSPSLQTTETDAMEPDNSLSRDMGRLEIPSNTVDETEAAQGIQNMAGEDSLLESAHGDAVTRYNSALDMTLKALCSIHVFEEYLVQNRHQVHGNLEERVPCAIENFFTSFVSKKFIKEEGLYRNLLGNLIGSLEDAHSMSSDAAELFVSILKFWPCWKSPQIESVETSLFTLEEYERMSCSRCRKKPNYPEKSSYGIVMAADSIRDLKCAFGNKKFEDILVLIRMENKMICDIKTGGCGKANSVHHIISRCPPIFTIVLEWENNETEEEISETAKALDWEIDMSRLYEGLERNTKYRLVSMVGCGEEEEHICLAYEKGRWVSLRHEALSEEAVGNWESVVRFCAERNVRPKIIFYEAAPSVTYSFIKYNSVKL